MTLSELPSGAADGTPGTAPPDRSGLEVGPTARPATSLRALVLRGSALTILGILIGHTLRLGSSLVLTRILYPDAFGVMGLVNAIIQGLSMLTEVGIGLAVIQNERGEEPAFLATSYTLQVLRGSSIAAVTGLLGFPLAIFYGLPDLRWLLPTAGLAHLFHAFGSMKIYVMNRRLQLGRLLVLDLIAQAGGIIFTVACAYLTRSVAALVLGAVIANAIRTALSHALLPGRRDRFGWDPDVRRAVFKLGTWIYVSTAITYFAMQGDRLVLGKLVSADLLGVYTIAVTLAAIPSMVVYELSGKILVPALSRILREPGGDRARARALRSHFLALAAPGVAALMAVAEPLVALLYDPRFHAAGGILRWLAIGTWLNVASVSNGAAVLAAGLPKYVAIGMALRAAIFFGLVGPVFGKLGLDGVAALVGISELGVLGAYVVGARRLGIWTPLRDLVLSVLVLSVGFGLAALFPRLAACLGSDAAVWGAVLACAAAATLLTARRAGAI